MSSEGENGKTQPIEGEDTKAEEENDSSKKPITETKVVEDEKPEEKEEKEAETPEENDKKETNDTKVEEKDEQPDGNKVEKEEDCSEEAGEESEKEDKVDENNEDDSGEKEEKDSGKDKKKNQKEDKEKEAKTEIPEGTGTELGEIPRIDASISRFKNDDLKLLHKLLFKAPGKTAVIKKNIKKFNGFDFKKDSEEYSKKLSTIEKFEVKQLKIICEMLDLDKKGNKEEVSERILEFLIEPKDSGKGTGGGRPKRTAAVKANNRGYSSHDESYSSDEKHTPRARRNMGKRANLKDETSSESDFQPSENSEEERPSVKKRKRVGRKKKNDSEEELSEVDSGTSDESDDGPKNKKKKVPSNSKVVTKGKVAGRGRGRKSASATPATPAKKKVGAPAKRGRKRAQESSGEEEESGDARDEEGSSSEDEPLAKKTVKAPQPPTDEEIKTYVKEILEGANLEEITMKTVCKQVYAHYPDFDLTHKKDYIKTTVKSLIST